MIGKVHNDQLLIISYSCPFLAGIYKCIHGVSVLSHAAVFIFGVELAVKTNLFLGQRSLNLNYKTDYIQICGSEQVN